MKFIVYLVIILLTTLMILQNSGGRYGSYAIFSWCWLLISITPILITIYHKRQFTQIHLVYLLVLVAVILIQPAFDMHPVFVLAGSLIIIVPFMVFEFTQKNKFSPTQELNLSSEVKETCRKLIGEDNLEKCFNLLLDEVEDGAHKNTILTIKQNWNQNKREKKEGLHTDEWLAIQKSKLVIRLLDLLK